MSRRITFALTLVLTFAKIRLYPGRCNFQNLDRGAFEFVPKRHGVGMHRRLGRRVNRRYCQRDKTKNR
jgi:hypothetical protein